MTSATRVVYACRRVVLDLLLSADRDEDDGGGLGAAALGPRPVGVHRHGELQLDDVRVGDAAGELEVEPALHRGGGHLGAGLVLHDDLLVVAGGVVAGDGVLAGAVGHVVQVGRGEDADDGGVALGFGCVRVFNKSSEGHLFTKIGK